MRINKIILENKNGVTIREDLKYSDHYMASNAFCWCGDELIVSPPVFSDKHEKGNPTMRCSDNGVHVYQFKNLKKGIQRKEDEEIFGDN